MFMRQFIQRGQSYRSWPLVIVLLGASYILSPAPVWPSVTFAWLGLFHLALCGARALDYFYLQRKATLLLFATVNLFFGLALLTSAFVAAPNGQFEVWRPTSRLFWRFGLPFFAIATYGECWWILTTIQERSARRPLNGKPPEGT